MNNHFYLTKESFNESNCSFSELEKLIYGLNDQINQINDHSGNALYLCNEIYDHWQWRGHFFTEIWQNDCLMDRDVRNILHRITEKAGYSDMPDIQFGDSDEDETKCNGLLTLKLRDEHEPYYQVDPEKHTWYDFCLDKIRRAEVSSKQFLDDCTILFDNMKILDRNYDTIKVIYRDFKKKILHHLDGLNRHLRNAQSGSRHRNDALVRLGALGHFDETPSTEGEATRKKDFTFSIDRENKTVCCEPHIKLCHSDNPGDTNYYFHRIYFHEGDETLFNGKTIVGHIGEHL